MNNLKYNRRFLETLQTLIIQGSVHLYNSKRKFVRNKV